MTRFSTAVFTEPGGLELEEIIDSYSKFPKNKGFLKFIDHDDIWREEYEQDCKEVAKMPDGRLLFTWDREFRRRGFFDFLTRRSNGVPRKIPIVCAPLKDIYPSFEEYAERWYGGQVDEQTGRWGFWRNPNAKWDGCGVSTSWASLPLKDGTEAAEAKVGDVVFGENFSTFAVVTPDGTWHANPSGFYSPVPDRDWYGNYKARFIDAADPSWTIHLLDCHI